MLASIILSSVKGFPPKAHRWPGWGFGLVLICYDAPKAGQRGSDFVQEKS